jgi:fucose permease
MEDRVLEELMADAGFESDEADAAGSNKYKQLMGMKAVHLMAVWALIYVGVEVTLGGES